MKTLTIALPSADAEFYTAAFDQLAAELLTEAERGQRGAGRSVLFRMIATAAITDFDKTVRLLTEVKKLAN